MIDKELMEQFQMLAGMMEQMNTKVDTFDSRLGKLETAMLTREDIEPLTDRAASKAAALVEERLGKRIDALTDGYKLTHEKQYELEQAKEALKGEISAINQRFVLSEK